MNKKVRLSADMLFYAALILYYSRTMIGMTTITEINGVTLLRRCMHYLAFALIIVRILLQSYTAKSLYKIAASGGIVVLSYFLSGYQEIMWGFLFVIAAKGIDMDKVARQIMAVTLIILGGVMVLAEAGVIRFITSSSTSRQYLWAGGGTAG